MTEAFPFTSQTFYDLLDKFTNGEEEDLEFSKSLFYVELTKDRILFVFDDAKNKVEAINVNFSKYIDRAEIVYDDTLKCLENGQYEFTKSGELKGFHIRTKAINSDDKIQMPNGDEITKITFWANKAIMNEIINSSGYEHSDDRGDVT